jgi:hypothetical protein
MKTVNKIKDLELFKIRREIKNLECLAIDSDGNFIPKLWIINRYNVKNLEDVKTRLNEFYEIERKLMAKIKEC